MGFASLPSPPPPLPWSYLDKQPIIKKGDWKKAARSWLWCPQGVGGFKESNKEQNWGEMGSRSASPGGPQALEIPKPALSGALRSVSTGIHIPWFCLAGRGKSPVLLHPPPSENVNHGKVSAYSVTSSLQRGFCSGVNSSKPQCLQGKCLSSVFSCP